MRRITHLRSSLSLVLGSLVAACGYSPEDAMSEDSSSTTDEPMPTTSAGTTASTTVDPTEDPTMDPTMDSGDDSSGEADPGDTSEGSSDEGDESTGAPLVPEVMGTFPGDGATGLHDDIAIVITFNTAMDPVATQAAYQSSDLPAAAVTFAWNDATDELIITPNDPLAYATGSDPAVVAANGYALTLTTVAQSAEGVALADDVTLSFSTLRRFEQVVEHVGQESGNVSDTGGPLGSSFVGDRTGNDAVRYAVTFDLTELAPDAEVEVATLRASWMQQSGNPWGGLGGGTVFQQVVYDDLGGAFDATAVGSAAGLFGGVGDTDVERDAAWALDEALSDPAGYGDRLQMRIRWLLDSDNDSAYDSVTLDPNDLELAVTYLAP